MRAMSRAGTLTVELLRAVEAYDPRAVLRALKRILPNHTRRVVVGLAVLALVNMKQQHGENWREHVIPSLDFYDKEVP